MENEQQHQRDLEDQRKRAKYRKKRDIEQKKEWEAIRKEVASKKKKREEQLARGFKDRSVQRVARMKSDLES